jgi:acetylornithine deacetylase/succinyl-diaminopimelate desuccinylase-like protein
MRSAVAEVTHLCEHPNELLSRLLRFDTTNPPGNERACIDYVRQLLEQAGVTCTILGQDPERPNLIARLAGRGEADPLLLYGHIDVVPADEEQWTHPPFEARVADGWIWGRGALDMKGGVAMMLTAFLKAKAEGLKPAGDIVLAILSDEEAGGDFGARFLVNNHKEQFEGIRYAIGEFGGFPSYLGGRKFYQIQVTEKQRCRLRVTLRGPAGYGSLLPPTGNASRQLAEFLLKLDGQRFPVHITPVVRSAFESMSSALPFPRSLMVGQLLHSSLTDRMLGLLGDAGRTIYPLFHHSVNALMIEGGQSTTIQIPSEISMLLGAYILPGFEPADLIAELYRLIGVATNVETLAFDRVPAKPDMGWFDTLASILRQADPKATAVVPMMLPAASDGRTFAQLGIQTYGFTPMNLPEGFNFSQVIHAVDERLPTDAVSFGAAAISEALRRYPN